MLLLLIYLFIILPGISYALIFGSNWIIDEHPKWRSILSIIASCISAYAVSFVLDISIRTLISDLTFRNIILPAISWGVLSITMYHISKEMAKHKIQLSIGFYIFGTIVLFASSLIHSYNIYIGIILFLIGVLSSIIKTDSKSSHAPNSLTPNEIEQTNLPTNQHRMEQNSKQLLRILKAKQKMQTALQNKNTLENSTGQTDLFGEVEEVSPSEYLSDVDEAIAKEELKKKVSQAQIRLAELRGGNNPYNER